MIKADFKIAPFDGDKVVSGFKTHEESLIGIYMPDRADAFTVIYLPTGSKINVAFPLFTRMKRDYLLEEVERVERECLIEFYSLLDLPWGCVEPPAEYRPFIDRILAVAAR